MIPAATSVSISRIPPSDAHRRTHRRIPRRLYLGPDAFVVLIPEKERADDDGDERDHDRERQSRVDVSGACNQAGRDDGKESAEPAVAEMIWKGHRGVPDPGGLRLSRRGCRRCRSRTTRSSCRRTMQRSPSRFRERRRLHEQSRWKTRWNCLLYTSDAADDL